MSPSPQSLSAAHRHRNGLLYGLGAYGLWGILPIYFKLLAAVPALQIVAHRVVWSLPFLALLITLVKGWPKVRLALSQRRTLGLLFLSALMIGANWLLYTYAVVSGHILAASFGYYLNPLANVVLGRFVLGERLSRLQWTAVAIAAAGVSVLAAGALSHLWISLTLCFSFALYGLLRKVVAADAVTGLAIETAILLPASLAWLVVVGQSGDPLFGPTRFDAQLLLLAGIVTTTPLLLFTAAARRLAYSTLGMLQFLAPTLQFLLAILIYGEQFTLAHGIAFASIWTALALYVTSSLRKARLPQAPE